MMLQSKAFVQCEIYHLGCTGKIETVECVVMWSPVMLGEYLSKWMIHRT